MHDKYAYEAFEMSLHDGDVERIRATGIAGLSIVADSLAAIRDTKVRVIRDERGLAVDFEREGEYVPFGNNDDRTDSIAVEITEKFMEYLRQHETYRHAKPTQSILTITSNVVYGKKTGTTPDGRIGYRCASFGSEASIPACARRYLLYFRCFSGYVGKGA